jgi:hypothetical protein
LRRNDSSIGRINGFSSNAGPSSNSSSSSSTGSSSGSSGGSSGASRARLRAGQAVAELQAAQVRVWWLVACWSVLYCAVDVHVPCEQSFEAAVALPY